METPERIKSIRKKKGFTQKQLAEKTGLSIASIQGYEQGKYKPKVETLQKIAEVLETDILRFFDENVFKIEAQKDESTGNTISVVTLTDREKYIDCYDNLNNLGKKEALKRVEELTEIKKYTDES